MSLIMGPGARGPLTAMLRMAARPVLYLQYLAARQILDSSAFPTDAGHGVIDGDNPLRLIVIGEATAVGYGTVSHELGIAGQLARQLAQRSSRGVEWSTAAFPDFTVHTARAVVTDDDLLARADLVVVMLGIGDSIRVTPVRSWQRLLGFALDEVRLRLPAHATIVVAETPPIGVYPQLPRVVRALAGRQARLLDEATRLLVDTRTGCMSVEFPPDQVADLRRPDTAHASLVYRAWAQAMLAAVQGSVPS